MLQGPVTDSPNRQKLLAEFLESQEFQNVKSDTLGPLLKSFLSPCLNTTSDGELTTPKSPTAQSDFWTSALMDRKFFLFADQI